MLSRHIIARKQGRPVIQSACAAAVESLEHRVFLSAGPATFASPIATNGQGGGGVAIGDVNGDGTPDVISVGFDNDGNEVVGASLNNGHGVFGSPINTIVNSDVYSLAVGDFNGDGKLDAVISTESGQLVFFFGDGTGAFPKSVAVQVTSSTTADPALSIAVGDFNGDGYTDAAVSTEDGDGSLVVVTGNASGTPTVASTTVTGGLYALSSGDINGDGHTDLVAAATVYQSANNNTFFNAEVAVLLGSGEASFAAPIFTTVSADEDSSVEATAIGDFTGDGKPDVAAALLDDNNQNTLEVLKGDGTGHLSGPISSTPITSAGVGGELAAASADFNLDGLPDVVVAGTGADVFTNNGAGGFTSEPLISGSAYSVGSVAVADFNGDGKLDIAAADQNTDVFLNTSPVPLSTSGPVGWTAGTAPTDDPLGLAAGDFNGDGKVDLAVDESGADAVGTLAGNGTGGLAAPVEVPAGVAAGDYPSAVTVADLNGDGNPDLIVASDNGTGTEVLLGQGLEKFADPAPFGPDDGAYGPAVVADLNGDGKLDVVQPDHHGVSIVFGNGAGGYTSSALVTADTTTGMLADSVAVGDFNGDGNQDLAVQLTNGTMTEVAVLIGDGTGNFSVGTLYAAGEGNGAIAVGDFDGDGHLDIASSSDGDSNGNDASITILRNDGSGGFTSSTLAAPVANEVNGYRVTQTLLVADFNGDGKADLAFPAAVGAEAGVGIAFGDGAGNFAASQLIATGATNAGMVAADLNGDGKPDLAVTDTALDTVEVLLNRTAGTPVTTPTVTIGNVTQSEGSTGTSTFAFPVTLSAASTSPVTVHYATADGTATTAAGNYDAASGTLTIPAGQTTGDIDVTVNGGHNVGSGETFTVTLSAPANSRLGTMGQATGTILNSGVPPVLPTVSIGSISLDEGNSGTTAFAFPVTLSAASTSAVTVHYTTADGTATKADDDYDATSGTLTIPAGSTTGIIDVTVNGDTTVEANETFTLTLSSPTNATLGSASTGTGTIVNDDTGTAATPATFSIDNVEQSVATGGSTSFDFIVSRAGDTTGISSVNFRTVDGTATLHQGDYDLASGTLTFAAGVTIEMADVTVYADPSLYPTGKFYVELSSATNATIPNGVGIGKIDEPALTPPPPVEGTVSGTVSGGPAAGGETIYLDANNNSKFETGELSTTTSAAGKYSFPSVPAGAYIVRQVLPSGYQQVTPGKGYGDHITVVAGAAVTGQNFTDQALPTTATITGTVTGGEAGETVYLDANNDSKLDGGELSTTTTSTGSYSFTNVPAGSYIIRQVLPTGVTQITPGGNYGLHITAGSGQTLSGENFTDKVKPGTPFSGVQIGTGGSYQNDGNTLAKAFDGNLSSFFDAPTANGDWVGLDLGMAQVVTSVTFAPRSGYAGRMVGGEIQASNSANFSSGVVTLATITTAPPAGSLTTLTLKNSTAYRYYRYLSPAGGYGNIAELEFLA